MDENARRVWFEELDRLCEDLSQTDQSDSIDSAIDKVFAVCIELMERGDLLNLESLIDEVNAKRVNEYPLVVSLAFLSITVPAMERLVLSRVPLLGRIITMVRRDYPHRDLHELIKGLL